MQRPGLTGCVGAPGRLRSCGMSLFNETSLKQRAQEAIPRARREGECCRQRQKRMVQAAGGVVEGQALILAEGGE